MKNRPTEARCFSRSAAILEVCKWWSGHSCPLCLTFAFEFDREGHEVSSYRCGSKIWALAPGGSVHLSSASLSVPSTRYSILLHSLLAINLPGALRN